MTRFEIIRPTSLFSGLSAIAQVAHLLRVWQGWAGGDADGYGSRAWDSTETGRDNKSNG
jgi:hypothetical protein